MAGPNGGHLWRVLIGALVADSNGASVAVGASVARSNGASVASPHGTSVAGSNGGHLWQGLIGGICGRS